MTPRVKICCITSHDEARLALDAGAALLGLVSDMPSGPAQISEKRIAEIAAALPPGTGSALLTRLTDARRIHDQQRRCGTNTLQLVSRLRPEARAMLREHLPGVKLVQVIHVTGPEVLATMAEATQHSDALLLDTGRLEGPVIELGGTGRTHDWEISREIVRKAPIPVFLAGGLNPVNVRRAISEVRPYGVDVCSGVRSDDRLDPAKLAAFMAEVAAS